MIESVQKALQVLTVSECAAIRDVFGKVLEKRARQKDPDCLLFRLLRERGREYWFLQLKEQCSAYVRELGTDAAAQKCYTELEGDVGNPAKQFDRRCMDFWAEMAAIHALADEGFHEFRPINRKRDPGTNDYYGVHQQKGAAYIEVKNLHANETLLAVLNRVLAEASRRDPSAYDFRLRLNYPFLRRPKADEERAIREFVASLRGRKPPFQESLKLGDEVATTDAFEGTGVFQTMGLGDGWPEPLDEDWLLGKVREHANTARRQIPDGSDTKVFVINIDSASGSLSQDFIHRAENEILDVFNSNVYPKVLFFREALRTS